MSEQKNVVENQKSVQEVSKHSKTDVRHWPSRVFKPWYTRDGEKHKLKDYAVKIQYKGFRDIFSLGTPNRAAAAEKARNIYIYLVANGWDAALKEFKPESQVVQKTHAT